MTPWCTPPKTNMTMENQPFEDVSPIKNGCLMCLEHIQKYSTNGLWMVIYHGRITNQTNPSHVRFSEGVFTQNLILAHETIPI